MSNYRLTKHSIMRAKQRGFNESDIPLILNVGTQIDDKSFFMLNKDVEQEIKKYKQAIHALERLRGSMVIMAEETILTIYHASQRTEKRALRSLAS